MLAGAAGVVATAVVAAAGLDLDPRAGSAPGPPATLAGPVSPAPAPAECTAYAAPTGSPSATGSRTDPFGSVDRLVNELGSGETGCLLPGDHVAGYLVLDRPGSTLRSATATRARLLVDTLEIPDGAADVTVSGLQVVGSAGQLTVRVAGDRFILRDNVITNQNAGRSCVLVGDEEAASSGGRIVGNLLTGCGRPGEHLDHAVYAQNVEPAGPDGVGLLVEDNVVLQVAGYAVQLYPRATGAVVRGNVIDGGGLSVRGGIVIDGEASDDDVVERNVVVGTRSAAVVQRTGSGHVVRDNCFWGNADDIQGDDVEAEGNVRSDECLQRAAGMPAVDVVARACRPCTADGTCAAELDRLCRLVGG